MKLRFLNSGFNDGFYNMALDAALLDSCAERNAAPALRFYGWSPPAVSLGYFQNEEDFRGMHGMDVVKRLTGGGAIVHDRELTFSLVFGEKDPVLPEDVFESYGAVCEAIVLGLGLIGIEAGVRGDSASGNPVSGPERKSPYFCFEKPSRFDVTAGGRKIAGSAQRRRKGAVLHHGSVPMEKADSAGAVSVEEACGRRVSFEELSAAMLRGFGRALGAEFEECLPDEFELERAASRLSRAKNSKEALNL